MDDYNWLSENSCLGAVAIVNVKVKESKLSSFWPDSSASGSSSPRSIASIESWNIWSTIWSGSAGSSWTNEERLDWCTVEVGWAWLELGEQSTEAELKAAEAAAGMVTVWTPVYQARQSASWWLLDRLSINPVNLIFSDLPPLLAIEEVLNPCMELDPGIILFKRIIINFTDIENLNHLCHYLMAFRNFRCQSEIIWRPSELRSTSLRQVLGWVWSPVWVWICCFRWIFSCVIFDRRPWSTASAWEETSASMVANPLKTLLGKPANTDQ